MPGIWYDIYSDFDSISPHEHQHSTLSFVHSNLQRAYFFLIAVLLFRNISVSNTSYNNSSAGIHVPTALKFRA